MYENTKYIIIPCIANPLSIDASDEFGAIHITKSNNLAFAKSEIFSRKDTSRTNSYTALL
jgi:hypothetical protein